MLVLLYSLTPLDDQIWNEIERAIENLIQFTGQFDYDDVENAIESYTSFRHAYLEDSTTSNFPEELKQRINELFTWGRNLDVNDDESVKAFIDSYNELDKYLKKY